MSLELVWRNLNEKQKRQSFIHRRKIQGPTYIEGQKTSFTMHLLLWKQFLSSPAQKKHLTSSENVKLT